MKAFTDHPADVGETYGQHFGVSFSFGLRMIGAGFCCLVHGAFPFLCKTSGSRMIERLNYEMCTHRDKRTRPEGCAGVSVTQKNEVPG